MNQYFCGCPRCTVGAVTGPVLLMATGVLFAMDQAGSFGFRQTWPVLLILYGLSRAIAAVLPAHQNRSY
jgi:uncharacterized protein YaaW (UPF0174 family)